MEVTEIHHAREVSKLASKRPDAWGSTNFGKGGLATPGQPITFYRSVDRTTPPETVFNIDETPRRVSRTRISSR